MSESLDTIAPHFRMVSDWWPDAQNLQNHYLAVVQSWNGNRHGLVEIVKSFLECVCLTILDEYGEDGEENKTLRSQTNMLVKALSLLGLNNTREGGNLSRILSAHNKLADALSDMRNERGPVAHGKDGFLDPLTANHLRTYLLVADTLLALLLAALKGTEPDLRGTREPYERFQHLHDRIDASVSVETSVDNDSETSAIVVNISTGALTDGVELRIEPSRLLYAIDRTAYIEMLAASTNQVVETRAGEITSPAPPAIPTVEASEEPPPKIISAYTGSLQPLADQLRQYIQTLNLPDVKAPSSGGELIDFLLATAEANMGIDWRERDAMQARMKVALKRTLSQFGLPDEMARNGAKHLVEWFSIQTVGLPNCEGGGVR